MEDVKSRGIIFSGEMVKELLAGRKTMTRRIVKPQPFEHGRDGLVSPGWGWDISPKCKLQAWDAEKIGRPMSDYCPYGIVGDRLWVRETWCRENQNQPACYRVSCVCEQNEKSHECLKWRSPIHMPRWASRITLEITGVKVERLHAITEQDAIAEGIGCPVTRDCKVPKFRELWEKMHGDGSWDRNDWIWVLSFKRIDA